MAPGQRLPERQPVLARRRGGAGVPGRPPGWPGRPLLSAPGLAAARADTARADQARVPAAGPAAGAARPGLGRPVRAADPSRRRPLPALLRRDRGARRARRLREPAHLPAGVGRPDRRGAPAGVRARPVLRGHQRGRAGGRSSTPRRRSASPTVRAYRDGLRRPDQPQRPLVGDGDLRADLALRPGDGDGDVPHALPRPRPGRPRGRPLPGDPGRDLPAVGRGGMERGERLRPLARPAPRVRRGAARRVRGVRERGRPDRLRGLAAGAGDDRRAGGRARSGRTASASAPTRSRSRWTCWRSW